MKRAEKSAVEQKIDVKEIGSITDKDILFEIGSIGAGHATSALSRLLHEEVDVEVPRLHASQVHLLPRIFAEHDTNVAAILMQLKGEFECDMMLIFETDDAKRIADSMLSSIESSDSSQEVEYSAIEEVGSMMIASFLNAVANFTNTKLLPTPPILVFDNFDAVMDEFLAKQALSGKNARVFDARFKRITSTVEGYLIVFPSGNLQKLLTSKGRKWLEHDTYESSPAFLAIQ